jgi:hypothetical protein
MEIKMNTKLKNKALLLGLLIAATGHAGLGDENTSEERRLSRSAPSSPQRTALTARNGRPMEGGNLASLKLGALSALRAQVQVEQAASPTGSTTTASGRTASVAATHLTTGTMFTAGSAAMTAEAANMFVGQNVSLQQELAAVNGELAKTKAKLEKLQTQTKRQRGALIQTATELVRKNLGEQIEGLASLVRKFGHKFPNNENLHANVDTLRTNAGKYVKEKEELAILLGKERKKTAAYAELTQQLAAAVLQLTRDPNQPVQADKLKPAGSVDNLKVMIDILNLLVSQKEQELEAMVSVKLDQMLLSKEQGTQNARVSAAQLRGFFIPSVSGQPSEFDRLLGNCKNALQRVLANNGMFGSTARVDGLKALTKELNALVHIGKLVLGAEPALRFAEEHNPSTSDVTQESILQKVHSERAEMAAKLAAASVQPEEDDDDDSEKE